MYRSLLVVLVGFMVCGTAIAAEEEKSVVEMGEVVVTAGRVVETVQEQTMNVTVITAEEIEASPAKDLGELLAEKGVGYIQKYPGALTTASIRGFKTNAQQSDLLGYSLVLINGRRAGTGNLAMIMTNDIERVEIIRGPGAVQYGSAAMGGVINVITREGAGAFKAEVFASYGSYDFVEGGFQIGGEVNRFDYSLGYSRSSMNDYKTATDRKYGNTGFDGKQSYSLNFGYRFAEIHRLGLSLNGTDIEHTGAPDYLSMNDLDDYRDSDYQAVDLDYTGETLDGLSSWSVRLFDSEVEDISYNPVESDPSGSDFGGVSFESVVEQQGLQAQVSHKIKLVKMVTGVDWYDYEVKSTYAPNRSTFDNVAGFLLLKSGLLNERLILDAGLRYDKFKVQMLEPAGAEVKQDKWVKNLGVAFFVTDNFKVRAHYGEAFKMPGADQLAADYIVDYGAWGTYQYLGNAGLSPETSKTYEAGIEYVNENFKADIGYFFTRFQDKIQSSYDWLSFPILVSWTNVGKSEISGIEVALKADYGLWGSSNVRFKPYLNLTYLDRYRDLDNNADLMYMNDMNASYGASLKLPHQLSARINFSYHGNKIVNDWENGGVVVEEGGYTVVDLGVAKELPGSGLVLSANVGNLFDKDYAFVKGYPMPGRNFQVSLKYRF